MNDFVPIWLAMSLRILKVDLFLVRRPTTSVVVREPTISWEESPLT